MRFVGEYILLYRSVFLFKWRKYSVRWEQGFWLMTMNFWFGGRIFEELFRVLLREKTVIFMLSNGWESAEGKEERKSQQNEG